MAKNLITKMRAMLEKHARIPFGIPKCTTFFADNPEESDEILSLLFDEYDAGAGDAVAPDIRALIKMRRVARKRVSRQRYDALQRMDEMRPLYEYPPHPLRVMYLALRSVTHAKESPDFCESLVRDYPAVACEMIAQLLVEQRREHLYEMSIGPWNNHGAEIDILRSMIARETARRLMDEMGRADEIH